jgi:hypothetical protein
VYSYPRRFPWRLRSIKLLVAVNVSVDGCQEMAGFEVSINGRFWVSTEGQGARGAVITSSIPIVLAVVARRSNA